MSIFVPKVDICHHFSDFHTRSVRTDTPTDDDSKLSTVVGSSSVLGAVSRESPTRALVINNTGPTSDGLLIAQVEPAMRGALPAGVTCGRVVDICHSCLHNYQRIAQLGCSEPRVRNIKNKVERNGLLVPRSGRMLHDVFPPSGRSVIVMPNACFARLALRAYTG